MEVTPGCRQTEAGLVPTEWDVHQLGEVASVKTGPFGSLLHERDYVMDGTPIITVEHLGAFGVDHFNLPQVSDADRRRLHAYSLVPGDIVFSRVGSVDRNALIRQSESGWMFSGRLLRVRPERKLVHPPFLSCQFHSEPFKRRVRQVAVGQTMASLNIPLLSGVHVFLPPLQEQEAIASALGDIDALLIGLERLIAKKRALKLAAMQQLLTGETRLPGFREAWRVKRLGEVADIVSGGTPRTNQPSYWSGDIKWCTPTDITRHHGKYLTDTERTISQDGLNNSGAVLLPVGALLLCSRATIGELKIAGAPICTNQGFKSLVCRPEVSNEFLYYKTLTMKQQMIERAFGSTFLEISTRNVASLELTIPPFDEQEAIAAVLSDMDAELSALEMRRDKTGELKQATMQELLTGKTRLMPFGGAHA